MPSIETAGGVSIRLLGISIVVLKCLLEGGGLGTIIINRVIYLP